MPAPVSFSAALSLPWLRGCSVRTSEVMLHILQQPGMAHQLGVSFLRNARSAVWSDLGNLDALSKAEEAGILLHIHQLEYVQDLQAILSVKYEV